MICSEEGIAAKRQQFVCSDTGSGSGITKTSCACQFFHSLGCNLCDVGKDRRQRLFTFRYRYCFTISEGADGMLSNPAQFGYLIDAHAWSRQ